MRIDSSGNVGIGTASPGQLLHLSSSGPRILLTQTSANSNAFLDAATSGVLEFSADDNNVAASSSMRFKVDGSEHLRIDSSGKVLIGSTAGSVHGNRLLQVGKTDRSDTYVSIVNSTTGTGAILFADTTTNDTGGYRGQVAYSHNDDSMRLVTSATEKLRITSSGNVGIGTSSPSMLLDLIQVMLIFDKLVGAPPSVLDRRAVQLLVEQLLQLKQMVRSLLQPTD